MSDLYRHIGNHAWDDSVAHEGGDCWVKVEPDLDEMAGYLSTIYFAPSEHHPDTMRPIVAEMLRIGLEVDDGDA